MQKTKVAIYGLTTEGYTLASKMVEKASVTIVDDTLQMAMDLDPQMVKSNRTLTQLLGEESLLGLKPISQVLSEARVILFAPKLRRTGDESIIESNGKMREVAKHISRGGDGHQRAPGRYGREQRHHLAHREADRDEGRGER